VGRGQTAAQADIRGQKTEDSDQKSRSDQRHGRNIVQINTAKELVVYQKAYDLSMRIFELSKTFPVDERFALTSQIRRSSRSVCLILREAWAKRRYEAHFVSKLTDCDGEANETDTSLDFAKDCGYITEADHGELTAVCAEVGKMLGSMIQNPKPFLISDR
jgi:four helix bundle protein